MVATNMTPHDSGLPGSSEETRPEPGTKLRVWDVFVRVFHWALGLSILVALISATLLGRSWISLHVAASVVAIVLVVLRIVWGFFGPGPARFSSFVELRPSVLMEHLRALRDNKAPRFIGHNPLGGLMVLALMATVLGLGLTGVAALGALFKSGPLAGLLPYWVGFVSSPLHSLLGNGIMVLIAAHLAGVFFESRRHRENLVKAMITGNKIHAAGDVLPPRRRARPLLALLVAAGLIAGGVWALNAFGKVPAKGLPVSVAAFDPQFADECSACHMIYNPSLLPAQDWRKLMGELPDHFGEDASLDEKATAHITQWLVAHAAETADMRASHVFRLAASKDAGNDAGGLASITQSRGWQHYHEDVPQALFRRKTVRSPANCVACHKDAEAGLFSPYAIDVPKE